MDLPNLDLKQILLLAYGLVNVIVFVLYALDKYKARHHQWRIPERTLILGAVFGIFGAVLGMTVMRHKTRKPKFLFWIPIILLVETAGVFWYYLTF